MKVTEHTIKRLLERFHPPPKNPLATISRLLNKATEEKLEPVMAVKRLINNGAKDTTYFMNNEWRFVIVRDGAKTTPILVTIEQKNKT